MKERDLLQLALFGAVLGLAAALPHSRVDSYQHEHNELYHRAMGLR